MQISNGWDSGSDAVLSVHFRDNPSNLFVLLCLTRLTFVFKVGQKENTSTGFRWVKWSDHLFFNVWMIPHPRTICRSLFHCIRYFFFNKTLFMSCLISVRMLIFSNPRFVASFRKLHRKSRHESSGRFCFGIGCKC